MSRLSRFLLVVVVLSIVAGTGALALGMRYHLNDYVAREARDALLRPEDASPAQRPVFERMELVADHRGRLVDSRGNIRRDQALALLSYYMDNRAHMPPHVIRKVSVGGSDFYVRRLPVFSAQGHFRLAYVNTVSLGGLLGRMNLIFAAVMAGSLLLATAVGIMAGKRVENAQGKLKAFFENASHDLRTPLTVIQGYADGIQAGVVSPEEGGAAIIAQGERMGHLVDEILMLSRIDAGQRKLTPEPTDLRDLVVEATSQLRQTAKQQQKRLEMKLPEQPVVLNVDVHALLRALQNMLDNALRHGREAVTVRLWSDLLHAHILVADDGPGIPEAELNQVFERYYRGSGGQNGIGLSLARELVALHGGKLVAYNDGGACLEITLPLRRLFRGRGNAPTP